MSRYYEDVVGFGDTCAGLMYRFVLSLRMINIYVLKPSSVRALQGHKVAYPTPLKAVLRAERAFLPNLEACGALKRASFVWTVDPQAGLLDLF